MIGFISTQGSRYLDAVTTNAFQQSKGRMRHVAVITKAPAGSGGVMRMGLDPILEIGVALNASLIALHIFCQLIVWLTGVHRVTGNTT